jgi:hypothetical protein
MLPSVVSFPSTAPEPTPWVGNVETFLVPIAEMLRTDGPNALTSKAYAEDFNEVKALGSCTTVVGPTTKRTRPSSGKPSLCFSGTLSCGPCRTATG